MHKNSVEVAGPTSNDGPTYKINAKGIATVTTPEDISDVYIKIKGETYNIHVCETTTYIVSYNDKYHDIKLPKNATKKLGRF